MDNELQTNITTEQTYHSIRHSIVSAQRSCFSPFISNCLIARYLLCQRRKNAEGVKLGISICHNTIAKGLRIYHYGTIIVNPHANVGENCKLHGDNCIGNKGESSRFEAPSIGNNVDIGIGAKILGGIELADNIKIGANAVVVKSELVKGKTLVGIPAHTV